MFTVTDYSPARADVSHDCPVSHVLELVAQKIGSSRFDLWFGQDTQCICNEDKITFLVRNNFAINSIRRHCQQEINQAVQEISGKFLPVEFVVKPVQKIVTSQPVVIPSIPMPIQDAQRLKSEKESPCRKFATMATFLEGLSNRLAYRAADLAIHHPGEINPVYIFGLTSVGKTHLLEGIWSAVRKNVSRIASRRMPMYMTAEQFLSSFVETIRTGAARDRTQNFRNRFKGISHLLIDDIQFFARAESTQTEFLQVFDSLRSQGVQLVFTGDRPLKDLPLRNELLCRLESGMVCEISLPERELSLQICRAMIDQRGLPMDEDVCRLIASRFGVHARQILGALNRLHAVYLTNGETITVAVAEEALSDLLRLNRRDVRLQDIAKIVSEAFDISEETLRSKSRVRQIATPRMLAMWLARKYTRSALSEIGLYFGNHSHSSVIAAQRKIDQQIGTNKTITEVVQKIEHVLG